MRYYVASVVINSTDTETRKFDPYDNYDTALRKFYEPFGVIGGGPKSISVALLGEGLITLKREIWQQTPEPTVVEEPEQFTIPAQDMAANIESSFSTATEIKAVMKTIKEIYGYDYAYQVANSFNDPEGVIIAMEAISEEEEP